MFNNTQFTVHVVNIITIIEMSKYVVNINYIDN